MTKECLAHKVLALMQHYEIPSNDKFRVVKKMEAYMALYAVEVEAPQLEDLLGHLQRQDAWVYDKIEHFLKTTYEVKPVELRSQ